MVAVDEPGMSAKQSIDATRSGGTQLFGVFLEGTGTMMHDVYLPQASLLSTTYLSLVTNALSAAIRV